MSEDPRETHGTGSFPPSQERDFADLIARAKSDLVTWLLAEKEFAQSQISARVEMAAQPVVAFGGAAVVGLLGVGALTMAAGFLLAKWVGLPLGFFIVAIAYLVGAYLLYVRGKSRMYRMLRMQVSLKEAKPDADWAPPHKQGRSE